MVRYIVITRFILHGLYYMVYRLGWWCIMNAHTLSIISTDTYAAYYIPRCFLPMITHHPPPFPAPE